MMMVSSIITSTQSRKSTTTTTLISTMWLLSTMSMLIQINGFIMVPSQQQQHQQGIIQRSLCNVGSNNSVTSRQQLPATTTSTSTKLSMIGDLFSGGGGSSSQLLLNDKTGALQESLVANTSLQNKQLKCVYRGSVDGWSAINFHNNVDGKGSCLVVILTRSGKLIGGFNPVGWRSTDDYYDSNSAFLWYAKNGRSPSSTATKCPILTGGNAAIFDYASGGPCFGASDLLVGEPTGAVMGGFTGPSVEDISVNAGNLRNGKCGGGGTYQFDKNWPVKGNFQVSQIEVYCNAAFADNTNSMITSSPSWWPF